MTLTVVVVGGGRMGGALAHGVARGLYDGNAVAVTVVEPNESARQALTQRGVSGIDCIASLTEFKSSTAPDIVLLAVKPQALSQLSAELALFCSRHAPKLILSILAGVTIDRLRSLIGAPIPILRAMPNTPVLIGEGVTACVASSDISHVQQTQVTQLLSSVGEVVWLETESLLDVATALSGSGPAYIFHMLECLIEVGVTRGLSPEAARTLAIHTMRGAASLALNSEETLEQLRINVTSPAGTTEAALKRLMPALLPLMESTLDAAITRAHELSRLD